MKLIRKEEIDNVIAQKPIGGKKMLPPFSSLFKKELPFGIIEDFEVKESGAEVHKNEGDLLFCLEGEVEFVCGGELIEPRELDNSNGNEFVGKDIRGGEKLILRPGDWLWIPPAEPHLHRAKFGRMVVIKVPPLTF